MTTITPFYCEASPVHDVQIVHREYRDARKIPLNVEHRMMLGMAPDYDHLMVIQKVEVFEHALDSTSGMGCPDHCGQLVILYVSCGLHSTECDSCTTVSKG